LKVLSTAFPVYPPPDSQLITPTISFLSQGTFYAFVTPNFIRSHLFDVVGLPSFDSASRSNTSSVAAGHLMLKEVDRRIVNDRKEIAEATAFSRDDDGVASFIAAFASID
jgi:hypothetical protein